MAIVVAALSVVFVAGDVMSVSAQETHPAPKAHSRQNVPHASKAVQSHAPAAAAARAPAADCWHNTDVDRGFGYMGRGPCAGQ